MNFKFIILGGTHGNEFTGIEVIRLLENERTKNCLHSYDSLLGNPKAYQEKKRFVDSDLNRCFGKNPKAKGYEQVRSQELKEHIIGQYDFLIDLHTTTTNMGLTIVITRNDLNTLRAACFLQDMMPEIKLITSEQFNEDCPYTTAMTESGFIIEVGAVAHNVLSAYYIKKVHLMLTFLLAWDFQSEIDLVNRHYYKSSGFLTFPPEPGFYIHPHVENHDFKKVLPNDPLFININGKVKHYVPLGESKKAVYPFFINEASYQDLNLAMSLSTFETDLTKIDKKM